MRTPCARFSPSQAPRRLLRSCSSSRNWRVHWQGEGLCDSSGRLLPGKDYQPVLASSHGYYPIPLVPLLPRGGGEHGNEQGGVDHVAPAVLRCHGSSSVQALPAGVVKLHLDDRRCRNQDHDRLRCRPHLPLDPYDSLARGAEAGASSASLLLHVHPSTPRLSFPADQLAPQRGRILPPCLLPLYPPARLQADDLRDADRLLPCCAQTCA
mmetsp:Transcript_31267/g.70382  ORF Transcript_31267/g.70382 Transcript_31267/m.70382 type:complete len:210 (+) Transcript_31267:1557-2186(+)